MFGRIFLPVCLFPAEKRVGSKKFSAKNSIFLSKWPNFRCKKKFWKSFVHSPNGKKTTSEPQEKRFLMIYDDFFDSFVNFFGFVTLVEKWWFWRQKHNFQLRIHYFGGKQTNSLFFLRNWNFDKFRCFFIPQMLKWHEKSLFYVLPKFGHDFISVLKKWVFSPLFHPNLVLKKFEVRVSKKLWQNVCKLQRCSKCVWIMFIWCFGSNWCALLIVKKSFCLRKIHLQKKLSEAFSTVFRWNWHFIWSYTWHEGGSN
jgi:hypothetical protein